MMRGNAPSRDRLTHLNSQTPRHRTAPRRDERGRPVLASRVHRITSYWESSIARSRGRPAGQICPCGDGDATATLTEAGTDRAAELHESYVALLWFFRSVLELETHETEAMELAGVLDPSVTDRLTIVLPIEELHEQGSRRIARSLPSRLSRGFQPQE